MRHLPGALNPADDASRGLHPHELINEHRWLQGPAFLRQDAEQWPASKKFVPAIADPEVKSTPIKYVIAIVKTTEADHGVRTLLRRILERANSSVNAFRVLAWIRRPVYNKIRQHGVPVLVEPRSAPLCPVELSEAESTFVHHGQESCFPAELKLIREGAERFLPATHLAVPGRTGFAQGRRKTRKRPLFL